MQRGFDHNVRQHGGKPYIALDIVIDLRGLKYGHIGYFKSAEGKLSKEPRASIALLAASPHLGG